MSNEERYCFLDLETTGFDHEKDSIIEISFITTDKNGKELDRFDQVVVPNKSPLNPTVTRITGIEQSELDTNGVEWESVLQEVRKKTENTVIIGHNIDFDIRFLRENGVDINPRKRIDTHELARILFEGEDSYALEVLSDRYGFTHTNAHRAMSDVIASKGLFFHMQQEYIETLPQNYLDTLHAVCDNHSDWYAQGLFPTFPKKERTNTAHNTQEQEQISLDTNNAIQEISAKTLELEEQTHLFVRAGDHLRTTNAIRSIAYDLGNKSEKSVIITPKQDYFDDIAAVPIPEILLDPEKLQQYGERENLSDGEITFVLKCLFRNLSGKTNFYDMDLFFVERDWWKEVCLDSDEHPLFDEALQNLAQEDVVRISPDAFARFIDYPLLEERVILGDEAELCAEGVLNQSTQKQSLQSYLADEKTDVAAQFFVRNICKEVIEPLLRKQVGPYPERILLPEQEFKIGDISWVSDDFAKHLQNVFSPQGRDVIRWLVYYPETGNIDFCMWTWEGWNKKKESLKKRKAVWFHRHIFPERNLFGSLFLGAMKTETYSYPELQNHPELIIPADLVSAKDEKHVPDLIERAIHLSQEITEENWIAHHFPSQETLRKVFDGVSKPLKNEGITVLGEKMAGGDGKLMQKLEGAKKVLLFTQKITRKNMGNYPVKTLCFQKFPFPAGNPLYDTLASQLDDQDVSWWNVWVVPQLESHLGRVMALYPELEKVYFLDTRENSGWGKGILKNVFQK